MEEHLTSDLVPITAQLIEAGKTGSGGWNRDQIEILGEKWPLVAGWKYRAIGKFIPRSEAERFIQLKGRLRKKQLRRKIAEEQRSLFQTSDQPLFQG